MRDLNGTHAFAVYYENRLERIFAFETAGNAITHIRVIVNPEKLRHLAAALGTEPAWHTPFPTPARR